jgi:quinoprotein glucose dehydrogenase
MKRLPFFIALILLAACAKNKGDYDTWQVTGGTKENTRYSTLTQIDTANVRNLAVAWTYSSGDADTLNKSQIQCNPIVVDGVLYATSPKLKVFALDALTGQEKWVFDPAAGTNTGDQRIRFVLNNNRGVTYWASGEEKRILFTASSFLFALDAKTGQPIPSFGDGGKVSLHEGLGRDVADRFITSTSPVIIY